MRAQSAGARPTRHRIDHPTERALWNRTEIVTDLNSRMTDIHSGFMGTLMGLTYDDRPNNLPGDIRAESHNADSNGQVNGHASGHNNDVNDVQPCQQVLEKRSSRQQWGENAVGTPPGDVPPAEQPSSRPNTPLSSNTLTSGYRQYSSFRGVAKPTIGRGALGETTSTPSHSGNAAKKAARSPPSSPSSKGPAHRSPKRGTYKPSRDDQLTFLKVLGLVMEDAPLSVLLSLRLTSWALYRETNAWLAYQFIVGKEGIGRRITKSAEGHKNKPRFVLDLRGPEEGCSGCRSDLERHRPRCKCISQTLKHFWDYLPSVPFDMVRVWVNSDQNLADFEDGEENLIKAKSTVYIVNIVQNPDRWVYLPTSPIGGSKEVATNMVVDPASTTELPTKPPSEYSKPNPNVTYHYFFTSRNAKWRPTWSLNKWPGVPAERKCGFLDVFTAHLVKTQLVDEPAKTYLVGFEAWPAEWMAAHRLEDRDWEQSYSVAVHDYVSCRMFPKIAQVLARLKLAEGLFRDEEEAKQAVIAATESYDWMTWGEYAAWWQKHHGLDLSFVLSR